MSNGTSATGFSLSGTSTTGTVDASIGGGSASTTTVSGGLVVTTGLPVAVTSGSQKPIGMQIARRTITTGEANSMHSTPIELIPAQGANTIIILNNGTVRVDRAATQTNASADFNMHYEGLEPGTYASTSIAHLRRFMYNETGDRVFGVEQAALVETGQNLTQSVNKAVEMSFDSATTTDCFTSIDVFMTYYVLDIS